MALVAPGRIVMDTFWQIFQIFDLKQLLLGLRGTSQRPNEAMAEGPGFPPPPGP